MKELTLLIPAKNEKESLPTVLEELKDLDCKIKVILEETDKETIDAIKDYDCEVIYQVNKGFGDALINGMNLTETDFFCIFNADGSFNPKELPLMMEKVRNESVDFVFGSRYEKNASSEDDTIVTYIGNKIFTLLGKIFFKLNISDILYTFVLGKTNQVKKLNLKQKDFTLCVELPIKANRLNMKLDSITSFERSRIGGIKKVNAFRDGFLILIYMVSIFFNK